MNLQPVSGATEAGRFAARDPNPGPAPEHRRAAVVAIDMVGYTRLMSRDEAGTHARYRRLRREVIDPAVGRYGGRIVKSTGDGVLVEFASALDAVSCAVDVQDLLAEHNCGEARARRLRFRIGINHGRIIVESDDIYGNTVNVAARLEAVAPPGGIAMSARVAELVGDDLDLELEDLGPRHLKHLSEAVHTLRYRSRLAR
jgi:adenylate cyclase